LSEFRDYDATLMLGPLYHLQNSEDRAKAFAEAVRATRPGGTVVAAAISRFAPLIDGLKRRLLDDPTFRSIVERDLEEGLHRNPDVTGRPDWFTTAYMHHPDELRAEAFEAGLHDITLVAVEEPAWILENPDDLKQQVYAAQLTEAEPALLGATAHLMVSGTRPAGNAV
jgi:SAM-dependent methyltransferase